MNVKKVDSRDIKGFDIRTMIKIYNPRQTAFSGEDGLLKFYNAQKKLIITTVTNADRINSKDAESKIREASYELGCLDRFYSIVLSKDLKNYTGGEILEKYEEAILDTPKRNYDISSLIDTSQVASVDGEKIMAYFQKDDPERKAMTYYDGMGIATKIKPIGYLRFKRDNNVVEEITRYRISKTNDLGQPVETEVFSNIIMPMMESDLGYREVVLHELLSDNNIALSKANSYVGTINTRKCKPNEDGRDNSTSSKRTREYVYNINSNYYLSFDQGELSAVTLFYENPEKYTRYSQRLAKRTTQRSSDQEGR